MGCVSQEECLILGDHRTSTIGPLQRREETTNSLTQSEKGFILPLTDAGVRVVPLPIDNLFADCR